MLCCFDSKHFTWKNLCWGSVSECRPLNPPAASSVFGNAGQHQNPTTVTFELHEDGRQYRGALVFAASAFKTDEQIMFQYGNSGYSVVPLLKMPFLRPPVMTTSRYNASYFCDVFRAQLVSGQLVIDFEAQGDESQGPLNPPVTSSFVFFLPLFFLFRYFESVSLGA
jgi:hypothetical protein